MNQTASVSVGAQLASVAAAKLPQRRFLTPPTAVAHYVTEFDLSSRNGDLAEAFHAAVAIADAWCRKKQNMPGFARREQCCGPASKPDAWAFHVQHRQEDTDGFRRYWYVDVGFRQRKAEQYRVRVTVSHSLDFEFIGWTPTPPEPSVPAFVLDWLTNPHLSLRSGSLPLAPVAKAKSAADKPRDRVHAMKVNPSGAADLQRIVFDPSRDLPIVLINGEPNPITFPFVPDEIQRRLVGTCYVVWAPPMPGWGPAWREHFPSGYSCRPNSVKIYLPRAAIDRQFDSFRHRFFPEGEIHRNGGPDAFVAMIRDGFTRRLLVPYIGRIANCEDVLSLRAEEDFKAHRSKLSSKEEEIALYESEYARVVEQNNLADKLLAESDAEKQQLADELASLRPHAQALAEQLESSKRELNSVPVSANHVDLLKSMVEGNLTVVDHLQAIAAVHPDAVQVLPSAIRSAQAVKRFEHVEELRHLLFTLVTRYRQMLLDGKGDHEACRVFGRNEIASREADNLSKEGRIARTFECNGRHITMEQHLKIGVKDSEARCLRIHFSWDAATQKIIIGHCGRHLPL